MDDDDHHKLPPLTTEEIREKMISSFTTEITSSSRAVATHILEAHQWDINAAVSAFNDAVAAAASMPNVPNPTRTTQSSNPLRVDDIPAASSPPSPIRFRSPRSPPSRARNPFSREAIQGDDDDDFDDKENDDAMESDDVARDQPSLPRRLILSDVTPQVITRTITIWRNGFTDVDTTLYPLDNPEYAQYLQDIENLDSPRVIDSPGGKRRAVIKLIRRQQEDFSQDSTKAFQGVGRTLSEPDSVPPASSDSLPTEATPTIDPTAPTTTIKIILADGTPIVSLFNTTHHTIRDVRDFIDAATPDAAASRDYQLLIMGMGSPPTPLATDLDQTIHQAGISNSVLTQKF
ncbi:plant UBX domain-containing protein 5-like isoform X1 [Raphanus sativus]|uniref:Plant UBX domain-containing protein 5-like isoform X1 n=1 Tax=Raphanus sativus TaxID=3726 RepID=A0A6J0NBP8_RAPSA|nr:plant UBX domain-containing protein 5-like isoform X1 [Raphanus sativus]